MSSIIIAWTISILLVTWPFPSYCSYIMQLEHCPCILGVVKCREADIRASQGTVCKAGALLAFCLSLHCKYVTTRSNLVLSQVFFFKKKENKKKRGGGRNNCVLLYMWQKKRQESSILMYSSMRRSKNYHRISMYFLLEHLKYIVKPGLRSRGFGLDGLKKSPLS